ncbi:glutaredoxin family protein [Bacillus sp. JJ1566]|uniref:glutaredoxin family protein n=1 Tax=Bacillus sp. JJ1566 TaxID=3122961 RepID=UPI002FFEF3FF
MNQSVTVYTTTFCPVCGMVKGFFDSYEISYKEVNVDLNPLAMIRLISKTKKFTVPQTNVNGVWVSGFDPAKILNALHEN